MNAGLSSKKTSSRVIIAHGIWREDLLRSFKEYERRYMSILDIISPSGQLEKTVLNFLSSSMTQ